MLVSSFPLVFALATTLEGVDGQCINLLSTHDKCRPGGEGVHVKSLQLCLNSCLNQKECLTIQWMPSTWACHISSLVLGATSPKGGQCLTLTKVECHAFDHTCMETTSNQMYNKDVAVNNVDALGCRLLCGLWPNCNGYTSIQRSCYLQKEWPLAPVLESNTDSNAKHGRKKKHCKTGERVVTFRYGANSNDAKKTDVAGNMTRCFDLLLGGSLYSMGVWNIQAKECWLHKKTANARGFFGEYFDLINFVTSESTDFRNSTQKACVKTRKGYSYKPSFGVLLEVNSRDECLHICLSTVNCHSVSWGGSMLCYLQQVPATKKKSINWSLIIVIPCKADKAKGRARAPEKAVAWYWRRVSTDDSNIRGLIRVPEVFSLLHCCVVCNRFSHCTGVTWPNQKSCYIKTVKNGSPAWKFSTLF